MSAQPPEEAIGIADPAAAEPEASYDAFISYSHQERAVARGLQRGLWSVGRRFGQRRALRVCRDATELTASPDLWGRVTAMMDASRFLVVLLSPAAAASTWVGREIQYWLDTRGPDNLLLVVGDGTLVWNEQQGCFDPQRSTAAPPLLTRPGVLPTQPFYVDVSTDKPWDPRKQVFREKVTDLAAPIHGVPKSDLAGDDLREQRRVRRLRTAAVGALIALTITAITAATIAFTRTVEAERERDQALALALAAQARATASENPSLAVALAAESLRATRTPTGEAQAAMVAARLALDDAVAVPAGPPSAYLADFGPDGTRPQLRYVGDDHGFLLVNQNTGRALSAPLQGHTDEVTAWEFDPAGDLLASGSADATARIWDPATGVQTVPPLDHPDRVVDVSFSRDGRTLATASLDRSIRVWDVATGDSAFPTLVIPAPDGASGRSESNPGIRMQLMGDGTHLMTALRLTDGAEDKGWEVRLWDVKNGEPVGDAIAAEGFDVSHNGRVLAVSGPSRVEIWDPATGSLQRTIDLDHPVQRVALSPTGQTVAVSGGSSSRRGWPIRLWDARTGERLGATLQADAVSSLQFSPDGGWLQSTGLGQQSRIWSVQEEAVQQQSVPRSISERSATAASHSPDGAFLAIGFSDGSLSIEEADSGTRLIPPALAHPGGVNALAFHPDGSRLATAGADGAVRVWSVPDGAPLTTWSEGPTVFRPLETPSSEPAAAIDVAFSPSGGRLATVYAGGAVQIRSPSTDDPAWTLQAPQPVQGAASLAFSPDGDVLATSRVFGTEIQLWDAETGEHLDRLVSPPLTTEHSGVRKSDGAVAFSPDGTLLATSGDEGTLSLWERQDTDWVELPLIAAHDALVTTIDFSPDGQLMFTGGQDNTIKITPLDSRQPIDQAVLSSGAINDLSVHPDGEQLAIATTSGVTSWPAIWDIGDACDFVADHVTRVQIAQFLAGGHTPHCHYADVVPAVALTQPTDEGREIVDQQNLPGGTAGGRADSIDHATSLEGRILHQTLVPSLPTITAVDVELVSNGSTDTSERTSVELRIETLEGDWLATEWELIASNHDGLVRFTLPGGGLPVVPGETLRIELVGHHPLSWKYDSDNPYPAGQLGTRPFDSRDFLFRTFGRANWLRALDAGIGLSAGTRRRVTANPPSVREAPKLGTAHIATIRAAVALITLWAIRRCPGALAVREWRGGLHDTGRAPPPEVASPGFSGCCRL